MHRKLKKTQKALPPFGWDTEPVLGGEEVVEESFVDVFCDLIYGGGWMDDERREDTDRECNWALVSACCAWVSSPSSHRPCEGRVQGASPIPDNRIWYRGSSYGVHAHSL